MRYLTIDEMLVFLELNGVKISLKNDQLVKLCKNIATNNTTIKQVVEKQ